MGEKQDEKVVFMMGADDGFSEALPGGKPKPTGICLLTRASCQSPRYGQVGKRKIQAFVRNKRKQMHIFKGFDDQSDTYHDTRTHYLMEQEPSLTQDQSDGDGMLLLLTRYRR
jgi:hypothetical protein